MNYLPSVTLDNLTVNKIETCKIYVFSPFSASDTTAETYKGEPNLNPTNIFGNITVKNKEPSLSFFASAVKWINEKITVTEEDQNES